MNTSIKNVIKFIGLYIAQAGALWGVIEGYTYFQDDTLKNFLGPFWILIYIVPLLSTIFFMAQNEGNEEINEESIVTRGDYSPGEVSGNYEVRKPSNLMTPQNASDDAQSEIQQDTSPKKFIQTRGNYSPGKVGGDYTVEE